MVRLAQKAEEGGFESVWVARRASPETRSRRSAAIAGATERIRVGTGIMNVFTRGPVVVAITFDGLDEIAPGRIFMGLGSGSPLILAPQGRSRIARLRMREYVEVSGR